MSFDITNRMAEEEAGLIKKRTPWEVAAEEKAIAYVASQGMERMHPRPSEAVFAQNQKFLKDADKKLQKFARQGHDVETAFRKALETQQGSMLEMDALAQAWKKENPNSNHFEVGGPETQRLYEQFTAAPKSSDRRGAVYTCDHCKKSSTVKLLVCSRCKKVAYCSKECQKTAWKAHKKTCIPWTKESEPKNLALSWDELEAFGGRPAEGKILEVRAMLDESMSRQVFQCKDRVGKVRRIAAYNIAVEFLVYNRGASSNGRILGSITLWMVAVGLVLKKMIWSTSLLNNAAHLACLDVEGVFFVGMLFLVRVCFIGNSTVPPKWRF